MKKCRERKENVSIRRRLKKVERIYDSNRAGRRQTNEMLERSAANLHILCEPSLDGISYVIPKMIIRKWM